MDTGSAASVDSFSAQAKTWLLQIQLYLKVSDTPNFFL